jgi:hypothetical protein
VKSEFFKISIGTKTVAVKCPFSYWAARVSDLEVASTTMLEGPKFSSSRVASDRNATAVVLKI